MVLKILKLHSPKGSCNFENFQNHSYLLITNCTRGRAISYTNREKNYNKQKFYIYKHCKFKLYCTQCHGVKFLNNVMISKTISRWPLPKCFLIIQTQLLHFFTVDAMQTPSQTALQILYRTMNFEIQLNEVEGWCTWNNIIFSFKYD